ncbi:MAG: DNA gyrase inhibitor YacG [Oceanospirillaceae bacterium]|nr:DNA gyrase inhibitor YacG [Oceanospirillaceae bacterium]|tara:strand:- start:94 stop:321 length:228 start_codon:yes stop_codon:yes gene_type:complete
MSDPISEKSVTVNCPECGKTVPWTAESRYRPFCSERCKLIDLGEWASGGHAIPGEPLEDDLMSGDMPQNPADKYN